ncbi:probable xyloglucan galactosyltransferase GT20 [Rhodamnia argentea]|uniref:Probable xyloglucan galactosyltransferase GT20 n=1 Tax=Rhodamnia argentea TaxID=178133 RepID=A0A8B8QZ64_9MYRT|nr:probable xyloglucan galactosyltransferase GT20 [Rhodamnia argentea]
MAISVSKKKTRAIKKAEERPDSCCCFFNALLCRVIFRVPAVILLFILICLWSSSTTIISGNMVHVCVSSRKLNKLYCLSAGAQPNLRISPPRIRNSSASSKAMPSTGNGDTKGIVEPVSVIKNAFDDVRDDEVANAMKSVEEQLEMQRSWISHSNNQNCKDRGIFVYDLPPKFNKDLVSQCKDMTPWTDFCRYFTNDAMGEPIPKLGRKWYQTHQYSLEPIFHSRVLKHPCRVYNENEAKLFYVPFYGGLDILRWHFKNVTNDVKDTLALELMKWLQQQRSWLQNSGKDHVFVLGKISWDFRRNRGSKWGNQFLEHDQMQNPIKILIERQPWHANDIGVPHPTSFHPHSDDDIITWQQRIIGSRRKNLVSFAGATRPELPDNIRTLLIDQCNSADEGKCHFLDCRSGQCAGPETIIELFTESEFCLQPPGDSPTRKSLFDSLVAGCIPVLFDPFTAYYQYAWHLPEDRSKFSVFVGQEELRQRKVNVVERLMKVPVQEREDMRSYIVYELVPGLVYGDSDSRFGKFQDAFTITMNNLLERMRRL